MHVPYYIVICSLSGSNIFLCIVSKNAPFLGGKNLLTQNVCSDFLYITCQKYFSLYDKFSEILSEMYTSLHVKNWLFSSDLNETLIFSIDF